ncbi:MAG: arsenite methyltransferase, partial [Planctomycetota bacterium]|nr:arsenite methyltransferase [Planctomycetota bacterium]
GFEVRERVREGYAEIARKSDAAGAASSCCGGGGCCGPVSVDAGELARSIGYDADELAALPEGANLGLSCGNPQAIAELKEGEVVVDLGSGAGFDCFLASPRVGATGRVIGVDMTAEMIAKARRNLESHRTATGLDNVEFRLGEIEHLPLGDGSVDCVMSNCVINLSPDQGQVWRDVARVLRPGGRVAVSDLALKKALPDGVRGMVDALIGCVAGASLIDDIRAMAEAAGLTDVRIEERDGYVESLSGSGDPLYAKITSALPKGETPSDFVTSALITARKPG